MKPSTNTNNYIFLGFLILLNIMNFVDRQLLASFANFIIPDLGLTNTQFGLLTGFGFLFFYSIMGLFMGFLADRFDRPKLIAFGVALWSILTSISGLAKNFIGLLGGSFDPAVRCEDCGLLRRNAHLLGLLGLYIF